MMQRGFLGWQNQARESALLTGTLAKIQDGFKVDGFHAT
jgi:hypothetical protein